jgi:NADPH-dependent ferric siderophore reductase
MGGFGFIFASMETMTIQIKSKNARKVIEKLALKDEVLITSSSANDPTTGLHAQEMDLSWVPETQKAHAEKITNAYKQAKKALDENLPLKSAKAFLDEL